MKKSTTYTILGIVAAIIVVFFGVRIMRRQGSSATSVANTGNGYNFFSLGSNSTTRQTGESFNDWYQRRKEEGFRFDTDLF